MTLPQPGQALAQLSLLGIFGSQQAGDAVIDVAVMLTARGLYGPPHLGLVR
jgi:hypothetical protein